jgi:hypothetical protein
MIFHSYTYMLRDFDDFDKTRKYCKSDVNFQRRVGKPVRRLCRRVELTADRNNRSSQIERELETILPNNSCYNFGQRY